MRMHAGKLLAVPKILCRPGDEKFPTDGFKRFQFPVRVCFGLKTNKSKESLFSGELGLNLREKKFSHGQFHVSISRTTQHGNVSVLTRTGNAKKAVDHEALC